MNVLGVHSGFTMGQHDPAAALICDGKLVAACEEERFVRVKSARGCLPIESIRACLRQAGLTLSDVDLIVHPGESFEDMPIRLKSYLDHYFGCSPRIRMINHQLAHLASAFFCSGFDKAMCLSYDAYGDRLSAALGMASNSGIEILETRGRENSLGNFYASMTSYLGFVVSEDEYKVMGLAAYGEEEVDLSPFVQPTSDGYLINTEFLPEDYLNTNMYEPFYSSKLTKLLGPSRISNEPITLRHKNIAFATQKALELCAVSLIKHLHTRTGLDSLCIAGGIGLNCSANYVIRQLPFIRRFFVQPASSDRGLALGCALYGAYENGFTISELGDVFKGPTYTEEQKRQALELVGFEYVELPDPAGKAAQLLSEQKIIGWYQGRSEFGPRALGNRSILADPSQARMKDEINRRVKFREEFRPFAPSVLEERAKDLFDIPETSPYMTVAYPVRPQWANRLQAITHVNGTARVQTVSRNSAPSYHRLISEFQRLTGIPAVLNTSFNVKGQPIVETPLDALSTFAATGLDALFIGPFMVAKPNVPRQ